MATRIQQPYSAAPPDSTQKPAPYSRYSGERRIRLACYVIVDLAAIWVSASIGLTLRFYSGIFQSPHSGAYIHKNIAAHIGVLLLYSGLIVLFCHTQRLYNNLGTKAASEEVWSIGKAVGLATALQLACIYLSRLNLISSFVIVFTMLCSFLTMAAWRGMYRRHLRTSYELAGRNVVVVGQGHQAQALHDQLKANPQLGYVLKGILDSSDGPLGNLESDTVLGSVANLQAVARANFIDEIFVCHHDREIVKRVVDEAQRCGLGVHIIPDLYDGLALGAPVEFRGHFPTLYLPHRPKPMMELVLKRWLDAVGSTAVLVLGSPLLVAIAVAVKLDSPGPVIYASTRIGRKGRQFRCYKFRTMTANAEAMKEDLLHLNERDGVLFKMANDPRITRAGRILRKYSLDELAQFWNVLKGEMSMVGPRPPLAAEVQQYELDQLRRLDVLPGITGLWQVESRGNPSFARYISLDVQYVERWHLLMDFKILYKTIAVVFAGSGQ